MYWNSGLGFGRYDTGQSVPKNHIAPNHGYRYHPGYELPNFFTHVGRGSQFSNNQFNFNSIQTSGYNFNPNSLIANNQLTGRKNFAWKLRSSANINNRSKSAPKNKMCTNVEISKNIVNEEVPYVDLTDDTNESTINLDTQASFFDQVNNSSFIQDDDNDAVSSNNRNSLDIQTLPNQTKNYPTKRAQTLMGRDYHPAVGKIYYPSSLMEKVKMRDGVDMYTVQVRDKIVMCLLCLVPINLRGSKEKDNHASVMQHVNGMRHILSAQNQRNLIRLRKYHDFWMKEKLELQKHQIHFQPQKLHVVCTTCSVSSLEYTQIRAHINSEKHKAKTLTWPKELSIDKFTGVQVKTHLGYIIESEANLILSSWKQAFRSIVKIRALYTKLVKEADNIAKTMQKTNHSCKILERIISNVYGAVKVHPFGSRISGLAQTSSDLDLFVDIGGMYDGQRCKDSREQAAIVRTLGRILKVNHRQTIDQVVLIPQARTPIIKLRLIPDKLECDLSFGHGCAVENTNFIRYCIQLQPVIKPVMLCLKQWSMHCQFKTQLNNYAIALMVVFFLQQTNHMLTVELMRKLSKGPGRIINGWETLTSDLPPPEEFMSLITPYTGDVISLLCDWYKFYAEFDYQNYVICPLVGYPLPKTLFATSTNAGVTVTEEEKLLLPPAMKRYVNRKWNRNEEKFHVNSLMCIQDPFQLNCNMTKSRTEIWVKKWIALCKTSFEHLQSI